jgi:hypothetical protein
MSADGGHGEFEVCLCATKGCVIVFDDMIEVEGIDD